MCAWCGPHSLTVCTRTQSVCGLGAGDRLIFRPSSAVKVLHSYVHSSPWATRAERCALCPASSPPPSICCFVYLCSSVSLCRSLSLSVSLSAQWLGRHLLQVVTLRCVHAVESMLLACLSLP